jgi:hypothetical protein
MMETTLRRILAIGLAVAIAGSSSAAFAQRHRSFGGGGFSSNGVFGLGLELGEPSGLNGKYFVAPDRALDFGIGAIYGYYRGGNGFHVYGDYLWHPLTLVRAQAFQMPFYVGVGARLWSFGYDCPGCAHNRANALGVRVPFGISFDFNDAPIDIFAQLVFVADFFFNYDNNDSFGPGIDGSVGVRYWFD